MPGWTKKITDDNGKVSLGNKLATYVNKAIMQNDKFQGSYWYTIEFAPTEGTEDKAPVINSDIMVVFRLADGVTTIVSPDMAGTPDLPESEPTTSYVIADYTRNGNTIENGCLAYVGEYEGRYTESCKHWSASAKINYDVPSAGIDQIVATPTAPDDRSVYNILGVKVSDQGITNNLPAGLYICNGKKVIVR